MENSQPMPKFNFLHILITFSIVFSVTYLAPNLFAKELTSNEENSLLTVHPRSDSLTPWMMPAHFGGPNWKLSEDDSTEGSVYDDVTMISIDYLTDEEMLKSYLPHPFNLEGLPVITVTYSMNRDISWLAGGNYNIIAVSARATYRGKGDTVTGNYQLVLWENLTTPILTGREVQGLPKIYGEIDDHRKFNGTWKTALSNNGLTMMKLEATDLKKMTPEAFEIFSVKNSEVNALGWKYIPNETGSAPILSYGTVFPISFRYHEAWTATGTLQWIPRTWEELPIQAHIVNALHALPIKKVLSCTVAKTSLSLHASKVRRLN